MTPCPWSWQHLPTTRNCAVIAAGALTFPHALNWEQIGTVANTVGLLRHTRNVRRIRTHRIEAFFEFFGLRAQRAGWYAPSRDLIDTGDRVLAEAIEPEQPTGRHFWATRRGKYYDGYWTGWQWAHPCRWDRPKCWTNRIWIVTDA